jgi:hypothetical protein
MQVNTIDNITLYGPNPLEKSTGGAPGGTMADIFPSYRSIVVGTGLHVNLALEFMEILADQRGCKLREDEIEKIYADLVAVTGQGQHLVIRSKPDQMEQVFLAAELLEKLVPEEMIRFTGRNDPNVRGAFKMRGESWKMAPRYFNVEEIIGQIKLSRISVGTENYYYYMIESGGRLLTYQEFSGIIESISDPDIFRNRIHEIVDLHQRRNIRFVLELDFFMVDKEKIDFSLIIKLDEYLQSCKSWGKLERQRARKLFEKALENFRNSLEPEFLRDDPNNSVWRTRMYSMLHDIPPTEESILGVSNEFDMNIKWQHGCRIEDSKVIMDPHVEDLIRDVLNGFINFYGPLEYINLGRVMRSQSQKRAAGSYREVYIFVMKQKGCEIEQIRFMRRFRRNALYYLNRGYSLQTAERMASGYIQYTLDRRELVSMLGIITPTIRSQSRKENLPGVGVVSTVYIDRPYVAGLASDKIPSYYFEHEPFLRTFAELMGDAAGINLVIGRSEPNSGVVLFGDGDEMLQFEADNPIPTGMVLADFTGAFADVVSPLDIFSPFYIEYLVEFLGRIRVKSFTKKDLAGIADLFIDSLELRIEKTRELLRAGSTLDLEIRQMLKDREVEINPILIKWEKTLGRLYNLDLEKFISKIRSEVRQRLEYI